MNVFLSKQLNTFSESVFDSHSHSFYNSFKILSLRKNIQSKTKSCLFVKSCLYLNFKMKIISESLSNINQENVFKWKKKIFPYF